MTLNRSFFLILILLASVGLMAQEPISEPESNTLLDWAKPKEYTIAGIEVECSEFTDKNIVRLLSGLNYDDKIHIPGDDISEAIKTYGNKDYLKMYKYF